jgi:hypothetical protein
VKTIIRADAAFLDPRVGELIQNWPNPKRTHRKAFRAALGGQIFLPFPHFSAL